MRRPDREDHDEGRDDAGTDDPDGRARTPDGDPGSLREMGDLLDEEGDDIRRYTGEPVETEDGWVVPRQQNLAGRDNIEGGGEWPDPDTPSAQPPPVEDAGSDRHRD